MKKILPEIFFTIFAISMIIVVLHLFPVGDPHLPGYADLISPDITKSEVPKIGESIALRYNKMAIPDTGSKSVVGAIILDYRGYDTLFETTVLFTAVLAVLSVIGKKEH